MTELMTFHERPLKQPDKNLKASENITQPKEEQKMSK